MNPPGQAEMPFTELDLHHLTGRANWVAERASLSETGLSHKLGWQGGATGIRLARCASSPSSVTAFHLKLSATQSGCMPDSP